MDKTTVPETCPNCHSILTEEALYCQHCGQKRIHPKDHSVVHLIIESVSDFFHFDSKFFRTLIPLIFKPGFLTIEFLRGRRARYFQPFKLFLFISFLYFLASGIFSHSKKTYDFESAANPAVSDTGFAGRRDHSLNLTINEASESLLKIPDDSLRKMVKKLGLNRYVNVTYPRESWLSRLSIKQVIKNRLQPGSTFEENLHKTFPKLVFLLIPFFALFLKLLYVRRNVTYFNHIIFSLHFLSFFFLLFLLSDLIDDYIDWFNLVAMISLMIYLYIALKLVYRQSWWKTSLKFALVFFSSIWMLIFFYLTAVSISFLMI